MKRPAFALGALIALWLIYLSLWPVPIDPQAWTPPTAPARDGVYATNEVLAAAKRFGKGYGHGPEDVAVDADGYIYTGYADGRIVRFQPDGTQPKLFAHTNGRPLGMEFDAGGNLIIADAYRGVLSVEPSGRIVLLTDTVEGARINFADDVDVAADGTIYFSDASMKFTDAQAVVDLMEHRPNGRLLAYEPATKTTRVVVEDLYFANGVAVSPDHSFLLVNETAKYRVRRIWLAGEKAGEIETFIENLPGFPDNIDSNRRDTFWLALASPRDPMLDAVLLPHPFLRKVLMRLPELVRPGPQHYGWVLGLDLDGNVIHNLQDPGEDCYWHITSATERNGALYLGSLEENALATLPAPTREAEGGASPVTQTSSAS